jgi:hypothetical protein
MLLIDERQSKRGRPVTTLKRLRALLDSALILLCIPHVVWPARCDFWSFELTPRPIQWIQHTCPATSRKRCCADIYVCRSKRRQCPACYYLAEILAGGKTNKRKAKELSEEVCNSVSQISKVYPGVPNSMTADLYAEGVIAFQR